MAIDKKISELTAILGAAVDGTADLLTIVDDSATETKKITVNEFGVAINYVLGLPKIDGLVCEWASDTTITLSITNCAYRSFNTALSVTWDDANGTALNGWDDDGSTFTTSKVEHYIWLLQKDSDGTLATVAAYNKTAPAITNGVFSGYSVVTLLTHFAVDATDDIQMFIKRGNYFSYTFSVNGLSIGTSTAPNATPAAMDLQIGTPFIDEIDAVLLNCVGSLVGAGYRFGFETLVEDKEVAFFQAIAAYPISFSPAVVPYINATIYSGDSNSSSRTLYTRGCIYNNIIGG